jgi:hypothetical protein
LRSISPYRRKARTKPRENEKLNLHEQEKSWLDKILCEMPKALVKCRKQKAFWVKIENGR